MGRKKKQKQVTVTESTPINYEGIVTIKKLKKGKVTSTKTIHNQGHPNLFKFILTCLAGDFNKGQLPGYCVPVRTETTGDRYVGNCVNISSKTLKQTNTDYYLEYKFYLPFSKDYITGFDKLYVYPDEITQHPSYDPSEQVISDFTDYLDMSITLDRASMETSSEDILIVWQLQLINPSSK